MKITLAGTSSGVAVAERAASSLFVESESGNYLIDCGEGCTRQLVRFGLPFETIQAVFISHMHPDHSTGIVGLLQNFYLSGRTDPVSIYLPSNAAKALPQILQTFHLFKEKLPFDVHFLALHDQSWMALGLFKIVSIYNTHLQNEQSASGSEFVNPDSFSFVLSEKQRRCVYTSDIQDLDHLSGWTRNIDVFITECTHIPLMEAIRFAQKQNVKQLVFTHIPPDMDIETTEMIAQSHFDNLIIAHDGSVVEV